MTLKARVKMALAVEGVSLADAARAGDLDYARAIRVINGYAAPRRGEARRLLDSIKAATRSKNRKR